jgi:chemotaxis signal transduction protein
MSENDKSPSSGGPSGGHSSGHSSRRRGRTQAGQYVCVFWLGGERYALDAVLVGEVISVSSLLPVPVTPPWLLGLCNLRGVALAVIDLARVLDLPLPPAAPAGESLPVLILRADGVSAGIRIERIEAVYPFEAAQHAPSAGLEEHPAVKGLLKFEARGGFVATLLDETVVARRLSELRFRKAETAGGTSALRA